MPSTCRTVAAANGPGKKIPIRRTCTTPKAFGKGGNATACPFPLQRLTPDLVRCVGDYLSIRDQKSLVQVSRTMYRYSIRQLMVTAAVNASAGQNLCTSLRDGIVTLRVDDAVSDTTLNVWTQTRVRTLMVTDRQREPTSANERPFFHALPKTGQTEAILATIALINEQHLPETVGQQLIAELYLLVSIAPTRDHDGPSTADTAVTIDYQCTDNQYTARDTIRLLRLLGQCQLSRATLSRWLKTLVDILGGGEQRLRGIVPIDLIQIVRMLENFIYFIERHPSTLNEYSLSPPNGPSAREVCLARWPHLHSGQYLKMFLDSRILRGSNLDRGEPIMRDYIERYLRSLLDSMERSPATALLTGDRYSNYAYRERPVAAALRAVAKTVNCAIMDVHYLGYPPRELEVPHLRVFANNDYGYDDHPNTFVRACWLRYLMDRPGQVPNLRLIALGHDAGLANSHGLYRRLLAAASAGDERAVIDVLLGQPRIRELLDTGRADRVVVRCRPDTVLPPDIERGEPSDSFVLLYVWVPTGTIVGVMRSPSQETQYREYVTAHHLSTDTGKEGDTPKHGMVELALDKRKLSEREYNETVRLYDFYS